jgi:hypothetical protein
LIQESPWYGIVEESEELEQGDYIDDCEVLVPTYLPIQIEIDALSTAPQKKDSE